MSHRLRCGDVRSADLDRGRFHKDSNPQRRRGRGFQAPQVPRRYPTPWPLSPRPYPARGGPVVLQQPAPGGLSWNRTGTARGRRYPLLARAARTPAQAAEKRRRGRRKAAKSPFQTSVPRNAGLGHLTSRLAFSPDFVVENFAFDHDALPVTDRVPAEFRNCQIFKDAFN